MNDTLNIVGSAATVVNGNFAGKVGIQTGSIISSHIMVSQVFLVFNEIIDISTDGKTLTLGTTTSVTGINVGGTVATNKTTTSPFRVKVPFVQNLEKSGIFAELPKPNVSNVNLADSNLIISKQITNQAIILLVIQFHSIHQLVNNCKLVLQVYFLNHSMQKDIPYIIQMEQQKN